jgi:PAS domain S-box-containing protein
LGVGLVVAGGLSVVHAAAWWEGLAAVPPPWWMPRLADLAAAILAAALAAFIVRLCRRFRDAERAAAQYREVLHAASDGVLGVDEGGRIIFASERACRLFGYDPGELTGRSLERVLSPHRSALVVEHAPDADPDASPGPVAEFAGKHKHGSELLVQCRTGPPLPSAAGPASTLFLRDITRTKQTRDLLIAREEHLRLVVEQMPAILWTTDTRLRITSTLGAGLAAVNLRPEEVIGMSMLECLERDDVESTPIAAHLKAVRGESLSYEMEWKGRTFQVRVDPLRSASKRVVGTVGILVDVTDRKQAEEAQRRLVAILEATPDFVAIAGQDGRLTYVNRAGREMLGLREGEDVAGRGLADLYPDDGCGAALHGAVGAATERGVWSGETTFRGRDGRAVPVSQVMIAHGPPGGPVQFLSTVARDISERQRLEEQCRQAQKMEAVGTLAGGVAHDFNNMLCVITGFTGFLLEGLPADSPLREFAREIEKAAERAAGLTRQLLAFSRKQMLAPRVLNLNALVADTEKMLRRLIGEDVELVTALDPALAPVRADPGQIEQVLMNLAVNARDAMPKGGRLTMRTADAALGADAVRGRPEVRPGPYVLLEVADTGCGMSPEVVARLFEPFFTTKEVGKGTGLGLATVYGIIKQSGGHIEVESAPGRGTTFRIYLPPCEVRESSAEPAARPAAAPGGAETVLLAEDEEGVRSLAASVLRQKGYRVLEAENGEEALVASERHSGPIDLLLTDAVMPRLGGSELAKRLRAKRPQTRVLFMSGFTDSTLIRGGVTTGEVDCLLKPFGAEDLARAVRQALDTPPPARTGGPCEPPRPGRARAERRQARRYAPGVGTRVACHRGGFAAGPNLAESLLDVSTDGVRVVTRDELWAGEKVELVLAGAAAGGPVKRPVKVVWSRTSRDGHFLAGLQLLRALSPAELEQLL